MVTAPPAPIPFPLSTFPGANPQESSGRLINCYSEPLGEASKPTGPSPQVWRRSPGLSLHAITAQTGYRGGLIVNNLAFEVFSGAAITVDVNGAVTVLTGALTGTQKISIAHDNAQPTHNIVVVDPGNGAFSLTTSTVSVYNGGGNLPQPNSVCFQDGFFFFTIGDNRCFASALNALGTQNTQTFITVQSRSDVTLLRGIAYAGLLWLFTTGHCEIWSDTAAPFPAFPYTRLAVIDYGLVQGTAIAGFEVGFSQLLWVAQDYGVYYAPSGQQLPQKVSSPDLEKLIEAQVRAGNTLEAYCYAFAGKKFWVLSSPAWTWEINLATMRWNERQSLVSGSYGRWRATGPSHPAFGKWLTGDTTSGDLKFIDNSVYDEDGQPQLYRLESGPTSNFPGQVRVARADFEFAFGTGIAVNNFTMTVTGAAAGTGGVVRLAVNNTSRAHSGDTVNVSSVGGTTEANGTWQINVIDRTHIDLIGSVFVHAWTSGGTAVDVTSQPNMQNPSCAISMSKDGGLNWGNPLVRSIGLQARAQRVRASVKNMGQSGPMGNKWRLDVTDPVYTAVIEGTQSSNPKEVGA